MTALCALLGPRAVLASSSICTISITSPAANASFPYGQSVTVTGTLGGPAIDTVTGALLLDGRGLLNFTTAPQTLSTTVPSPSSGTHTLSWSCSASGQAGSGSNSGSQTFTVAAAPTPTPTPFISNISPASGPVGTSVTISGGNFGSTAGTVKFNGTQASATWGTSTIYATVPSGATTGSVSVTTAGSQSASGPTFTVTAPASPTPTPFISGISPASGPVGTSVTISGGNFGSSAGTVRFNGTQASATWGTSTIYATVPSGATTGSVSVTTAGGQSASGPTFTVTAPASPTPTPFISGISPASGPVGTSVTISGGNFGSSAGTVRFNGTQASATWGTSTIYATVPSGATTGSVSVTTAGSQSASGPTFTVTAPSYTISGTVTANGSGLAGVTMGLTGGTGSCSPIPTTSSGSYSCSVNAGGNYTVTPSKAYYGFTPASASFSNLSGNQTAYFTAWPLTATLSNLTRGGNSTLYIGDDFQIVVTGPANLPVTIQTSQNGGPYSSPAQLGTTNNNGNGSGSYTYAANAYVGLTTGSWSALWSVGTVAAPLETFSVLGNTIQGTVTGGGTATISESWNNPAGKTITGSTTTVSGGSYTLSVGPGGSKYVVTPSEAGYTFIPAQANFGSLIGNLTGVNFTATAAPPTVQLTVNGQPWSAGATYHVGDSFTVILTGPVGAVVTEGGWSPGSIPGSGTLTISGTWTAAYVGSYSETWYVGGAVATPNPLSFSVACSATMPCIYSLALAPSGSDSNNGTSTDTSRVQITGTNFGAAESDPPSPNTSAILFTGANGPVQAPSVHDHTWCNDSCDWNNTVIHVQVPEGARTGYVTVWVNGQSSNGVPFTLTTPSVTCLSANSAAIGSVVAIYGAHFADTETKTGDAVNDSAVLFNGVPAPSVHSCDDWSSGVDLGCHWSDTTITVTVPAGATIGNVNVTVTVNGQVSNAVGPFTVAPAPSPTPTPPPAPSGTPTITSVSPSSGVPGTVVAILGSGFGAAVAGSAQQQSSAQQRSGAARLAQQRQARPETVITAPPNSKVLFSNMPGDLIAWSDTEIDVAVPNLAVGTDAAIAVWANGVEAVWGPGAPASGFSFTVQCCGTAPYITAIVPQTLAFGASGILTFYGQNLSGVTGVYYGNTLPGTFPLTVSAPVTDPAGTMADVSYAAGAPTASGTDSTRIGLLMGSTPTNSLPLTLALNSVNLILTPGTSSSLDPRNSLQVNLSTGDTATQVTVTEIPSYPLFTPVFSFVNTYNLSSACAAALNFSSGNGYGTVNSTVTAAPAGCSGVFGGFANSAGANTSNTLWIAVPPQIMIQTEVGEAGGQTAPGDASMPAILLVAQNRFGDNLFPGGMTGTWQAVLVPKEFYGASNKTANGVQPELNYAAEVFGGTSNVSIPMGCEGYWSPTDTQFATLQTWASQQAGSISDSSWPNSVGAPNFPAWNGHPKQAVIKSSIFTNAGYDTAPAFVLFQLAPSATAPAVITIP